MEKGAVRQIEKNAGGGAMCRGKKRNTEGEGEQEKGAKGEKDEEGEGWRPGLGDKAREDVEGK